LFHEDHIHPKKHFKKSELKKKGIPDSDIDYYQENKDKLANLQLLAGMSNIEKSSTDFETWLKQKYTNDLERRDFMRMHYIPDVALDFKSFQEFIIKRRELIKKRFREILPVSTGN
jgi:hypothetical protein